MDADDEASITSEERISWLRERGVKIEFPGDESQKQSTVGSMRSITIVRIPINISEQYENVEVLIDDDASGDQLIKLLKPNFSSSSTIDEESLNTATEKLLVSNQATGNLSVSKNTLEKMLKQEGHVETFSLTRPCQENKWTGILLYLDEAGQLKNLEANERAAALASCCGFKGISLAGVIYIGRYISLQSSGRSGIFRHESFTVADLDSSSDLLRNAERDNFNYGKAVGQVAMESTDTSQADKVHESNNPNSNYKWTQTEESVEIVLPLEKGEGSKAKKQLMISITSSNISVIDKSSSRSLANINLLNPINKNDSTWSISGDNIEFYLEKLKDKWWDSVE